MGQYKVPQNVESEDKILGPLSMKQFIYAMIGVGWAGLTFAILRDVVVLWVIIGIPPALALLALGLYQKDDQPLEIFVVAMFSYFTRPKARVWRKEPIEEAFHLNPPPPKPEPPHKNPISRSQLSELSRLMDTHGWSAKQPALQEIDTLPSIDLKDRLGMQNLQPEPAFVMAGDITENDDMLSDASPTAQGLNTLIENSVKNIREEAAAKMKSPQAPSISGSTAAPSGAIVKLATEGGDLTVSQLATLASKTDV